MIRWKISQWKTKTIDILQQFLTNRNDNVWPLIKKKKKKKSAILCYDLCKLQSKIKFLAKPTLLTN